jgi:hypothetical protein
MLHTIFVPLPVPEFPIFVVVSVYTETTSKIGFRLRRLAIASEPACIAQLN